MVLLLLLILVVVLLSGPCRCNPTVASGLGVLTARTRNLPNQGTPQNLALDCLWFCIAFLALGLALGHGWLLSIYLDYGMVLLLLLLLLEVASCVHFSTCACHPCARVMLVFSASFQFQRLSSKAEKKDTRLARSSCCLMCITCVFLVSFAGCAVLYNGPFSVLRVVLHYVVLLVAFLLACLACYFGMFRCCLFPCVVCVFVCRFALFLCSLLRL